MDAVVGGELALQGPFAWMELKTPDAALVRYSAEGSHEVGRQRAMIVGGMFLTVLDCTNVCWTV